MAPVLSIDLSLMGSLVSVLLGGWPGWNKQVIGVWFAKVHLSSGSSQVSPSSLSWGKQFPSAISFYHSVSALDTGNHVLKPLKPLAKITPFSFKLCKSDILSQPQKGRWYLMPILGSDLRYPSWLFAFLSTKKPDHSDYEMIFRFHWSTKPWHTSWKATHWKGCTISICRDHDKAGKLPLLYDSSHIQLHTTLYQIIICRPDQEWKEKSASH